MKINNFPKLPSKILFTILIFIFSGIYQPQNLSNSFYPSNNISTTQKLKELSLRLIPKIIPLAKKKNSSEYITLMAVGDIMLSRTVEDRMKKHGWDYPFQKTASFLKQADLVFGNLETPLIEGRRVVPYQMIFRAPPESAAALKKSSFSVLSLANNHTYNQGLKGLKNTISLLEKENIITVGAGIEGPEAYELKIWEEQDIKIGFLSFAAPHLVSSYQRASSNHGGIATLSEENIKKTIASAHPKVDVLIVSLHFGLEYQTTPSSLQKKWAHLCIDERADLIIGHHPHVLQSLEIYKDKPIIYSLGNFIFDQMQWEITRRAAIASIQISAQGVHQITFWPTRIYNYAQPQIEPSFPQYLAPLKIEQKVDFYNIEKGQLSFSLPQKNLAPLTTNKAAVQNNTQYQIKKEQFKISQNGKTLWQTPSEWQIKNFALTSFNTRYSTGEKVLLLLNKKGYYGEIKPFWITPTSDQNTHQHLYLYDLTQNPPQLVWGSSGLENELLHFIAYKDYIVVLEKNKTSLSGWQWQDWGYHQIWDKKIPSSSLLGKWLWDEKGYFTLQFDN